MPILGRAAVPGRRGAWGHAPSLQMPITKYCSRNGRARLRPGHVWEAHKKPPICLISMAATKRGPPGSSHTISEIALNGGMADNGPPGGRALPWIMPHLFLIRPSVAVSGSKVVLGDLFASHSWPRRSRAAKWTPLACWTRGSASRFGPGWGQRRLREDFFGGRFLEGLAGDFLEARAGRGGREGR